MTPAEIRHLLAVQLPTYRVDSVVDLGEGWDNVAYLVNDELIVRVSKDIDPARRAAAVWREVSLLNALRSVATLGTPEPLFVVAERGVFGYRAVPGTPLIKHPEPIRAAIDARLGEELGAFLTAIHHATQLYEWADRDDWPPKARRAEAAREYVCVRDEVPLRLRPAVERFLAAEPPAEPAFATFCHNDLGIEHVLVDAGQAQVTGVIDWSDAAITDPAADFALLCRDLGVEVMQAALANYEPVVDDAALPERAMFYARCATFGELAYGLETGRRVYADNSLAALDRLFAG